MKKNVFDVELAKIKDERVRLSAATMLEMLPDYIFEIPASSSGLHHPGFSLGKGGLVRHVKVAMRILEELFRDEAFGNYSEYQKDLIRMALLLHDGLKDGLEYSGHTNIDHPIVMANFVLENEDSLLISHEDALFVSRLISSHMGPWNKDKNGNEVLPVPKTKEELLVHLCDYIASRKFLNVSFENNEIVDSASDRPRSLSLTRKKS